MRGYVSLLWFPRWVVPRVRDTERRIFNALSYQ